jgi:hypothetical protein
LVVELGFKFMMKPTLAKLIDEVLEYATRARLVSESTPIAYGVVVALRAVMELAKLTLKGVIAVPGAPGIGRTETL